LYVVFAAEIKSKINLNNLKLSNFGSSVSHIFYLIYVHKLTIYVYQIPILVLLFHILLTRIQHSSLLLTFYFYELAE